MHVAIYGSGRLAYDEHLASLDTRISSCTHKFELLFVWWISLESHVHKLYVTQRFFCEWKVIAAYSHEWWRRALCVHELVHILIALPNLRPGKSKLLAQTLYDTKSL